MIYMKISEHIRQHLYNSLTGKIPDLDELIESEWSKEFEQLMHQRLIMGRFRYGPMEFDNRQTESIIKNIKERADLYLKDRNTEFMVDIANLAMKIFVADPDPRKYFKSEDDKNHTK